MRIRVASTTDAVALNQLVGSLSDSLLEDGYPALPEWFSEMISLKAFEARLQSDVFYHAVCEVDGRIVGYLSLKEMKERFQVYHLFVAKPYQRRGISRTLWSHVTERLGPSEYFVRSSLSAVPVYQAFGFVKVGEAQTQDGILFQPMERAAPREHPEISEGRSEGIS